MAKRQRIRRAVFLGGLMLLMSVTTQATPTQPVIELDRLQVTGSTPNTQRQAGTATALRHTDVQTRGLQTAVDAARYVPGLYITNAGARAINQVFSIRGLVNAPTLGSNAVNLFLDDAPYGNAVSYTHQLYGLERIEFSRGPQGTRFGKNSYAGAISLSTRQPGETLNAVNGEVTARVSRFDQRGVDAWFGAPLIEQQVSFSLTAGYAQEDGILSNTFRNTHPDSRQQANGRLALFWSPTDRWNIQLSSGLEYYNDGDARLTALTGPAFEVRSDTPGTIQQDAHQQALRVEYQGEAYHLLWVGHHRRWHLQPLQVDVDLSERPPTIELYSTNRETQWSQELRLSSLPAGDWHWQAVHCIATGKQPTDHQQCPVIAVFRCNGGQPLSD